MRDEIHIKDLLLRTIVGINEDERINKQDVVINLWIDCDMRQSGQTDDINAAVNYRTLTKKVIQLVENSQCLLVERLAEEIAALSLEDPRVERVRVRVEKPGALRFAASVGVTIERDRSDVR